MFKSAPLYIGDLIKRLLNFPRVFDGVQQEQVDQIVADALPFCMTRVERVFHVHETCPQINHFYK
jgi:hypothetical protein